MNLESMKGVPPDAIRGILAQAVLDQLPSPLVPRRSHSQSRVEAAARVIAEARERLGIGDADYTSASKARISDFIASALAAHLSASMSTVDVKARLGERGDLPLKAYDLNLDLKGQISGLRVTATQIREVLERPDAVQHLVPPTLGQPEKPPSVSLYVKLIKGKGGRKPYVMLIQTMRSGFVQRVDGAWRAFPSEIDLTGVIEPLEILKRFVDVYGLRFQVGTDAPHLFVMYTRLPPGQQILFKPISTPDRPFLHNTDLHGGLVVGRNADGTTDVAMAFLIDMSKYREALRRHGIM